MYFSNHSLKGSKFVNCILEGNLLDYPVECYSRFMDPRVCICTRLFIVAFGFVAYVSLLLHSIVILCFMYKYLIVM